ncbi:hypothetical protein SprV_0802542100 [Sparganum proliferum]
MIGRNYAKFFQGFIFAFVCLFLINFLCTLRFDLTKSLVTFSVLRISPGKGLLPARKPSDQDSHKDRLYVPLGCQYLKTNVTEATGEFRVLDSKQEVGIYSVFLDKRKSDNVTEKRSITGHRNGVLRILLAKKRLSLPKLYCHFLGTGGEVHSIISRNLVGREFAFYELTENHLRPYGGYSVHCDAPDLDTPVPSESGYCGVAVSTSASYVPERSAMFAPTVIGGASRALPTEEKSTLKLGHKFGICVPALHSMHSLNPWRLDEWIQIHMRLGATKFRIYYSKAILEPLLTVLTAPRLWNGLPIDVELIPLMWPDHPEIASRLSWYYFQIITVNDCLYRSMRDVEFVFFGDLDEILVPVSPSAKNWGTLTDHLWNASSLILPSPGYCFNSAIFPTSEPARNFERPFHRRYTQRVEKLDTVRRKCLVRPLWIFEMGIHHISKPYEESTLAALNMRPGHSEIAIVHHYRFEAIDRREHFIEDKSLERFLP